MKDAHLTTIKNFIEVAHDFQTVLEKVPEGGMDWSEKEGEWSIRQVILHVADDLTVYTFIIERALAVPGDKVVFGEFPGNQNWADQLKFDQRAIQPALNLIYAQRSFMVEMLEHFPDRWDNKVNFYDKDGKQVGSNSVKEMILMLTEHMQEHIEMVEKILEIHQVD
jgi:hypothetical protein